MKKKVMTILFLAFLLLLLNQIIAVENISVRLDWDESDIINGEEFKIQVNAFNLEEKDYDVKVFIYEEDKDKPISQTLDEEEKWVSSSNYYNNFFKGSGEKTDKIRLRINKKYADFSGIANIGVRLRETGKSTYRENEYEIEVIKSSKEDSENDDEEPVKIKPENIEIPKSSNPQNSNPIQRQIIDSGEPIKLQNLESKKQEIYESGNEIVKKYFIYAFALLCIMLIILLVWKRL
jgi:hypothetical protein